MHSAFNHVNYADENINVAIPVFSIHGNHDDPSGEGHLAALDILSAAGLINYYGRTPESDNIQIKPLLLQKGRTKLALYGMSNVRDERLFRTFRDGHVKFFQPSVQTGDWFNIMSVHQNHHAYTETSFLPERFLPNFMDLIIWGHEHECKIDPEENAEMGFKVMQPGSSVATSLVKGEAVPKHVAIVSVTGIQYEVETIRLKTVRPFIVKEIALRDYREARDIAMADDEDNRGQISKFLSKIVHELIDEAKQEWYDIQGEDEMDEDEEPPLPIIRLRVETTPPEGGKYNFDNPQRFSGRFAGLVANSTDVVQYHRKRTGVSRKKMDAEMPDEELLKTITIDTAGVGKLVKEFLTAQSLTILPQNSFSDAVSQYVDKDDKHAMQEFIEESLKLQQGNLIAGQEDVADGKILDDETLYEQIERNRKTLDDAFDRGERKKKSRKESRKPRPDDWDSDEQGQSWEDSWMSMIFDADENGDASGDNDDDDAASVASMTRPSRGRGSRGGRGGRAAAGTTRKAATASKKAPAKAPAKAANTRSKKKPSSEDEEQDAIMIDDDDEGEDDFQESSNSLFVKDHASKRSSAVNQSSGSPLKKPAARAPARGRGRGGVAAGRSGATQQTLSFGTQPSSISGRNGTTRASASKRRVEPSDDEISDDDDAFEPPPAAQRGPRSGR